MLSALQEQQWDLVLSDFVLPQFGGLDALKTLQQAGIDVPFIVVSGQIGEDVAVEAMKAGAHDYLMKGQLARLAQAVGRELAEAENRRRRRKVEEDLRVSEEKLRALANQLLRVQEEERRNIARELHDQIGQPLNLLKLLVERANHPEEKNAAPMLKEASQVLAELIDHVSVLSLDLRPRMLDDLGLADDHQIIRQGLRSLLESEPDLRVVGEAGDGDEALQLVEERRPDVLVLDMLMPGKNGIEVTRRVAKQAPFPSRFSSRMSSRFLSPRAVMPGDTMT